MFYIKSIFHFELILAYGVKFRLRFIFVVGGGGDGYSVALFLKDLNIASFKMVSLSQLGRNREF